MYPASMTFFENGEQYRERFGKNTIPGAEPKPLPAVVEAAQLKKMLGLTSVNYTETNHTGHRRLYTRVNNTVSNDSLG